MSTPGIFKTYTASGAILARSLVKLSAAGVVTICTAATDKIIGVTSEIDAADGDRVDVQHTGIAWVKGGAATGFGDALTSDASGRAVTAAPAGGSNVRLVGFGIESASAANDVINVQLALGVMQG